MDNITVTVSGSALVGKTTVCNVIEAALAEKGFIVAVDNPDGCRHDYTDLKTPVSVTVTEKQRPRRSSP